MNYLKCWVSFLSHSDKKDPQLRLRVLFCAGAGRIRTGRPSADGKKQSCGLFFRPRLANPPAPTKKLWQRYCRSFFSLLYRTKSAKAMTDFQSAFCFIEISNCFRAVGFFCCPLFLLFSECSISPQPETVEWFMPILQNQKPGTELQRALAIRAENRYNSNCYLSQ